MRHVNLFLAAATVVFGSVTALSADPFPASNSTEVSARDQGPAPVTVPVASTPSPVAEAAAGPGMKGQPEEVQSGPILQAGHLVAPQPRPAAHRVRLGCFAAHHHAARVAKPTGAMGVAAPWATVSPASASEQQCGSNRCLKFVLLGVGY